VSKLIETREKLAAKQREMTEIVKAATTTSGDYDFTQVKGHGFDDLADQSARVDHFKALHSEMADLGKQATSLKEIEDIANSVKQTGDDFDRGDGRKSNSGLMLPGTQQAEAKSLGEMFTDGAGYKAWQPGSMNIPELEIDLAKHLGGGNAQQGVKTLMTTSAGFAPQNIRTGRVVDFATTPIDFLDVVPMESTDQAAVVYMEETTFTNSAAETAEGGAYAAGALAFTQRTQAVQKIAVYLPVTDEQLEDVAQVQSLINNRLTLMVRQRLNLQALKGNGTPPNLQGIQTAANVQTYALAAEPVFDAVIRGMDKVINTGQAMPDAFVPNASDWLTKFRLARTPDGIYILGSPNDPNAANSIWGLRVAPTQQQTAGTSLVGSFAMYSGLAMKRNITLSVGFVNDDFIHGQVAIRCDVRCSVQTYRPTAFCTVTNL